MRAARKRVRVIRAQTVTREDWRGIRIAFMTLHYPPLVLGPAALRRRFRCEADEQITRLRRWRFIEEPIQVYYQVPSCVGATPAEEKVAEGG